ncbi:PREDICTED: cell cycle checkpoint protein RAD17 isoform X2 [Wasmannia auropunctata]|uniref:cell cycle checkpoint protein RAD17 isoform X2 n=1 Tax=Wasmannia auropunctata TaxID=64793 RepID=UPI0005EDF0C1|nr:PREDICTED: cell cycle checkpoint protein RAD17 isoform X2 [Wasmannia auropunctata]
MVESKGSNAWCVPSFDCEPVNKPLVKRAKTARSDRTPLHRSSTQSDFKRKKHETSLSKLLQACEPQKSSELAISRQKQNEISRWLQDKSKGQPSMLILSGPSGCGKTAAVKLLARENDFDVVEWITPVDPAEDENNRVVRQGDRFEDHLIRATRYHTVLGDCSKQLLLVKDLPNVYQEDCKSFFELVEKYFQIGREPVIFVCTETGNSKLMRTLFSPDVREKFGIDLININAATPTAMKNMLKRVSGTLNSIAGDMLHVSQRHIDEILSNSIGDVRSAVLNLIFVSLRVPEGHLKSECGIREETLGLLHGIGRVTNPKRKPHGDSFKFDHDPEEIAAFFQSHSVVFVKFLQENYLNTIRTLEEAAVASDILSLGDVLNSEWRDPNLRKVALSYCIRGLMLTNEKPVTAWNPVRKPRDDHSNIRRCLVTAEARCYEAIIKSIPKETNETLNEDEETIIEED